MNEFQLKYGCNPNQKPSRIYMADGSELPIQVLNGKPGYINFLDAFNGYQLVKELKKATGLPAATSFKHVSPAGAAVGLPLTEVEKKIYWVDDSIGELSPLACAYARARGADRMSSFGDFISLSDVCDVATAKLVQHEVSDGIIAPGYEDEALEILKSKKKGNYNVIQIDPEYKPEPIERKQVYGVTFEQGRNEFVIDENLLTNLVTENKVFTEQAKIDLIIALITLKYTQSNSVCYPFKDSVGRADRDNAIDLYIGDEYEDLLADGEWERVFTSKPEVFTREEKRAWLDGNTDVALGSDAFFPFGDNIERAFKSGVKYIAQPGGSIRDDNVIEACNKHNIAMCFTGMRLFHH